MTALQIIESTLPLISGSKVSKESNYDTLLTYLNFAKSKLARDTNLWIGGESITLTTEEFYTLSTIPLQIIEVYDDSLRIRPRNSFDLLGYTQTAPNIIHINSPVEGEIININWFEEPADYILTDEVFIPNDLIEAMQHYMASKVFEIYKSEKEDIISQVHEAKYQKLVGEYMAKNDTPTIDSIYATDMISNKGFI